MITRRMGRTDWQVSEVGYGMWGMAGWTGSEDQQSLDALRQAVQQGVNFFDTAWAYGEGHSEKLLGQLLQEFPDRKLYVATKIPPKNRQWPARASMSLDEVFPAEHIQEYVERSLENLGVSSIDLMQFHVWNDRWASDGRWQQACIDLKARGLVNAWGISINRWEPTNVVETLKTGLIDVVQVVYNLFDQNPEDVLFPLCQELDIGVIARVPFDEGSLTGTLSKDSTWPEGDWRNGYFKPENLVPTLERVEKLKEVLPAGMSLPELALRFILHHRAVSTTIPGMRKPQHVEANTRVSDGQTLPPELLEALKLHRWERVPV